MIKIDWDWLDILATSFPEAYLLYKDQINIAKKSKKTEKQKKSILNKIDKEYKKLILDDSENYIVETLIHKSFEYANCEQISFNSTDNRWIYAKYIESINYEKNSNKLIDQKVELYIRSRYQKTSACITIDLTSNLYKLLEHLIDNKTIPKFKIKEKDKNLFNNLYPNLYKHWKRTGKKIIEIITDIPTGRINCISARIQNDYLLLESFTDKDNVLNWSNSFLLELVDIPRIINFVKREQKKIDEIKENQKKEREN